jgi:hypothetical protein
MFDKASNVMIVSNFGIREREKVKCKSKIVEMGEVSDLPFIYRKF